MRNFRRLAAVTALAGVAVVLIFTGPASSAGATIKVATTSAGCKGASPADFTTIQGGINAASTGDTVLVCPGQYDENLTITTDGITVKGVSDPLKKTSCSSLSGVSTKTMAIIKPSGGGDAITITANDVSISQMVVRDQDNTATDIVTDASHSGTQISGSVLWQIPNLGIELLSDGTDNVNVTKNCFVGLPGFTNAAIDSEGGNLSNAKISSNGFMKNYVDQTTGGAIILAPGTGNTLTSVKIKQNTSSGDGMFLSLQGVTKVSVGNNTATKNQNTAVFVGGDNFLVDFQSNSFTNGHEEGFVFNPNGGAASQFISLRSNTVDNSALTGIDVQDNSLTTSLFQQNTVTNGGVDGLRVSGTGNSGLAITTNTLQGNAVHDCHDDTTGSGSGGTANLWVGNSGEEQNRDDLCDGASTNTAGP